MWPFKQKSPNKLGGRCIVICSHGRTGTNWIGHALSLHPDFLCSHSSYSIHEHGTAQKTSPAALASLVPQVPRMSVDQFFDHLIAYKTAKHYVSTHNYQINTINRKMRFGFQKRRYKIFNMIRNPVTRVTSLTEKQLLNAKVKQQPHVLAHAKSQVQFGPIKALVAKADGLYPDTDEAICFLASLSTIWVETFELKRRYRTITMESLTGDRETFKQFFLAITDGTSHPSDEYLDSVFALGKMNKLVEARDTAEKTWAQLPSWQKRCWAFVDESVDLVAAYKSFGYDLSFIRNQA